MGFGLKIMYHIIRHRLLCLLTWDGLGITERLNERCFLLIRLSVQPGHIQGFWLHYTVK
jgi:hypothetical protein